MRSGTNPVVLISLPSPWLISDQDCPPRGILSIAATLRQKRIPIIFVDLAGQTEDEWLFPEAEFYGISATTPQFPLAQKVIEKIRKEYPEAKICIGGVHATVLPEETFSHSGADYVVVGEGEEIIFQLLRKPYPGIYTSNLIRNLDRLPMPAFDLLSPVYFEAKTNKYIGGTKEGVVQTARGCPYNCAFCCERAIWRGKVRYFSLENVRREILWWLSKGCDQIYFNEDQFITSQRRLIEVTDMLSELRLSYPFNWHCLIRADTASLENLMLMTRNGCKAVTFGVESGSQKMLDLMNKKLDLDKTLLAIFRAKELGLKVRAQMVVGFPGETDETVEETARFVKCAPADIWGFHAFVPFPGCDVWNNPKKYGFEIPEGTTFADFHTIGKPNEWHKIIHPNEGEVRKWLGILRQAASDKNIDKKM